MFASDDTIVAIATPPGRGGLGVVRISGTEASVIAGALLDRASPLQPRHATVARLVARLGNEVTSIDRVVATSFPEPGSYTGEDVVEISAHGSPVLLEQIVALACRSGARLAEPGEFTLRAFLHGRVDLVQAEAVADLIDAVTPLQARLAFDQLEGTMTERIAEVDRQLFELTARLEASLDFPEEGYHFIETSAVARAIGTVREQVEVLLSGSAAGRLIREGCEVVVLGRPNVGKSSIFNQLLGSSRAIVTPVPGTTRDLVSETMDLDGLAVNLIDSAGIRVTGDPVEAEGVSRARQAFGVATACLVVVDRSQPLAADDRHVLEETSGSPRVVVVNKADRPGIWSPASLSLDNDPKWIEVSALTGQGIDRLREELRKVLVGDTGSRETPMVANIRHIRLLEEAALSLGAAAEAAEQRAAEEFVLADLERARSAFEELTGKRTPDDVLNHIFERFCIGK